MHGINKKCKALYAFCSGFRPRCFTVLYKEYTYKCPAWLDFGMLSLITDSQWRNNIKITWYMRMSIGKEDLAQFTEKMMIMSGKDGYFTNYSFRHSTVTRLFDNKKAIGLITHLSAG